MHSFDEHTIEPDGRALDVALEHPSYLSIRFGRLSRANFHEDGGCAICLQKSDFKVSPFKRHDVTVSFGLLTHQCEMPSNSPTTQRPCWGQRLGPRNTFFVTGRPAGANYRAFSTFNVG